ncbi:MAG: tRNA lysidine(34) synthetase TilS, partial [Alphaproteobacteria bacterium]|nr:tRNA lysidine(34) synthetase TilS [Alphaproteobacteria bacterium]
MTVAATANGPVTPGELPGLFDALQCYDRVYLAVSGGVDSTALMHLAVAWQRQGHRSVAIAVLSVDHGLRPEARREAEAVAEAARELGLPAEILTCKGLPPRTAIQASARDMRFAALCAAVRRSPGRSALVLAHHRDDVAETVLMRLSRGAGVDGLS